MNTDRYYLYDPQKIGRRIRLLRENARVSQIRLARDLCVSRGHLCRVENGSSGFSPENMMRLADYFDVTLEYLYFGRQRQSHLQTQILRVADFLKELASDDSRVVMELHFYDGRLDDKDASGHKA